MDLFFPLDRDNKEVNKHIYSDMNGGCGTGTEQNKSKILLVQRAQRISMLTIMIYLLVGHLIAQQTSRVWM